MSSEWKEMIFEDFLTLQRGHDLPDKERCEGNVPVLGSFGVTGYHNKSKAKGPGVTIGRSGASFGVASYTEFDYWPLNTALYVTDFKGNCPRFVYYFLKVFDFSGYNSGSAQPSLNRNNIYPTPITVPTVNEQERIAELLSALDDRIALLRETNATLESIAQAMFKSWFIDFDPVKAKQQGQEPQGMDAATAALFPDAFQDSELGAIPAGWRVGTIGDIARSAQKKISRSELHAGLHYVGLEHMPRHSLSLCDWGTAENLESTKTEFNEGDILFGKLRPYFHKVAIAPFDGVCSTDILAFCPKRMIYYGHLAMHLFSDALIDYADRLSNGAKMPRVNWKDIAAYKICILTDAIAKRYTDVVDPLFAMMKENVHKIQTLASIRDTLLPRLISGRLRLPEAEAMAGEATA